MLITSLSNVWVQRKSKVDTSKGKIHYILDFLFLKGENSSQAAENMTSAYDLGDIVKSISKKCFAVWKDNCWKWWLNNENCQVWPSYVYVHCSDCSKAKICIKFWNHLKKLNWLHKEVRGMSSSWWKMDRLQQTSSENGLSRRAVSQHQKSSIQEWWPGRLCCMIC